ncbi:MAG: Gfo/Idh/MocA family oxidoreductase, partial [Opitutales bacterium]
MKSSVPPSRLLFADASRRRFLQQVSLGLGAATFAGLVGPKSLALGETLERQEGRKLGVALVGLGNYATHQLAPALQETQYCRLSGIVTGTPAKEEEWAQRYDIPQENIYNYDNYDDIADNPDIDIVYVVLPVFMHAEYTIRAAQAGKHVICEKPMAMSVRECEQMIEACEKANRKLSIGYRLHFEPHTQEMMRLGQDEGFGKVKMIEASFGFRIGNPDAPHMRWRLQKDKAGGGALMDVGVYAIQGTRQITGEEPVSVSAQEVKTNPEIFSEVDETLFWQLKFPSGAAANCGTSY